MPYPSELNEEDKAVLANFFESAPDFKGVYMLTPMIIPEGDSYNCLGWAVGVNSPIKIPDTVKSCLFLINQESKVKYIDTPPDELSGAKFILWGESATNVTHISVLLTFDEMAARAKFGGFNLSFDGSIAEQLKIENPFWSSALGQGYGAIVHPMEWFSGSVYGRIVAGIKPKPAG